MDPNSDLLIMSNLVLSFQRAIESPLVPMVSQTSSCRLSPPVVEGWGSMQRQC